MLVSFTLSMPGCNSWNGKWSGEGQYYAIVRSYRGVANELVALRMIETGYYHYNFGDGWAAGVTVNPINSSQKAKLLKKSQGFHGYDWMIDSIERDNVIKPLVYREPEAVMRVLSGEGEG